MIPPEYNHSAQRPSLNHLQVPFAERLAYPLIGSSPRAQQGLRYSDDSSIEGSLSSPRPSETQQPTLSTMAQLRMNTDGSGDVSMFWTPTLQPRPSDPSIDDEQMGQSVPPNLYPQLPPSPNQTFEASPTHLGIPIAPQNSDWPLPVEDFAPGGDAPTWPTNPFNDHFRSPLGSNNMRIPFHNQGSESAFAHDEPSLPSYTPTSYIEDIHLSESTGRANEAPDLQLPEVDFLNTPTLDHGTETAIPVGENEFPEFSNIPAPASTPLILDSDESSRPTGKDGNSTIPASTSQLEVSSTGRLAKQPEFVDHPEDSATNTNTNNKDVLQLSSLPSATPASHSFSVSSAYIGNNPPHSMFTPSTTSFLSAGGFRMPDFYIHLPEIDGWQLLLENVAPNALYNSLARYDAPTCDEDTRVEAISEIVDWIDDRQSPKRLLCITGPAGSGKSALQQTIAQICSEKHVLGASFFVSRLDPSRNQVGHIVPTIAYQLGQKDPAFKRLVSAAVEADHMIFHKSLHTVMDNLVVQPFIHSSREKGIQDGCYVILIDGLDECLGEDRQHELLAAIDQCILSCDVPFRVLIASRPERAIRTALEPGGHLHEIAYQMPLEKYDATRDIRRYVLRRFTVLYSRVGNPPWFTEEDVETIVEGAEGQFFYVAAVFRYISERRANPLERLKIILDGTPARGGWGPQPFRALDVLYTNILLGAKETYEPVDTHTGRDFLLLFRTHQIHSLSLALPVFITSESATEALDMIIGLEPEATESLFFDLSSLVVLDKDDQGGRRLRLHHKTFADFLGDKDRAEALFVPADDVHAYTAKRCMHIIKGFPLEPESLPDRWAKIQLPERELKTLEVAIAFLPDSLRHARADAVKDGLVDFARQGGWEKLDKLLPLLYNRAGYRLAYWVTLLAEGCAQHKFPRPDLLVFAQMGANTMAKPINSMSVESARRGTVINGEQWDVDRDIPITARRNAPSRIRRDERLGASSSPAISIFPGAQNFQMGSASFHIALTHSDSDTWKLLSEKSAPNAFHNSRARYDCPKCDDDTRIEVTTEIMNWIEDRNGPQRLLCMTGAAGAGKSALQQTTAECCVKSKILGSAFFFGAADPTRNTATPVVPTIAFQLGLANPALKEAINLAIETDPTIFSKSLQEQMDKLIAEPARGLRQKGLDPKALPAYAILIDGLDECKGEGDQSELLVAIKESLLASDLPFRVFIASRPEPAIRSGLDPDGDLHELAYHIQLSEKYDATADIRRYLWRRFRDIGRKIRDPRVRSHWPTAEDVEILVRAASGQFIYAATVVKYVSEHQHRVCPSNRLRAVMTWTPAENTLARPFETLDRLYASILSEAKDAYESVDVYRTRDFLLLFRAYHMKDTNGLSGLDIRFNYTTALNAVLGLEELAHEYLISDLQSLVIYEPSQAHGFKLRSYHRSFSEFMENESRSQELFVPSSRVYAHIVQCSLQNISQCDLSTSTPDSYGNLEKLPPAQQTALISVFAFLICILDSDPIDDEIIAFSRKKGWDKIDTLLSSMKPNRNRWVHEVVLPRLVDILSVSIERVRDRAPELVDASVERREKWRLDLQRRK